MALILNNIPQWSNDYETLSSYNHYSNVYRHYGNKIYTFYMKCVDNNYKNFTQDEAINYLKLTKLYYNIRYDNHMRNAYCQFCETHHFQLHGVIKFCGWDLTICGICEYDYNTNDFSIIYNNKYYDNVFINYAVKNNNQIKFFYKGIFNMESYNYFYNLNTKNTNRLIGKCSLCQKNNIVHKTFICNQCYHYSYQLTGLQNLYYISSFINFDVYSHILYYLLLQSKIIKLDFMSFYKMINKY